MEFEYLSSVSKNERESKEITPISATFFIEVKKYLQGLEEEIEKYNNTKSIEYKMLSDELNSGIGKVEEIFFFRMNKIYSMAAQVSHLANIQHKNYNMLLPEEKKLYDAITQSGESFKRELLDPTLNLKEESEPEPEEDKQKYALVRILKDMPAFAGIDGRSYAVKADDVLTLPSSNAQGLIKKNAAKLIVTNSGV